mmetsp:Transcript_11407/g.26355  ORF Transcript_11407/g.26355 Transcript_11407/m.26355 type:complete len:293 (+) Transcript_11407:28-906(+)
MALWHSDSHAEQLQPNDMNSTSSSRMKLRQRDQSTLSGVSCIPLGSWCGPAVSLKHLGLREAAYPFDWNRTDLQAIFDFVESGFVRFFSFQRVDDHSEATGDNKWHGKLTFCGDHHSVWHEDLRENSEHEKYLRRIDRFFHNPSERLLFIRAVNGDDELEDAPALLELLENHFPNKEVFLLMIIDAQHTTSRHVVRCTGDRLLVFRNSWRLIESGDPYEGSVPGYHEPILWALDYVKFFPDVSRWKLRRSLNSLLKTTRPYTSGRPQEEPWIPDVPGGSDSEGDPCPECPFQ